MLVALVTVLTAWNGTHTEEVNRQPSHTEYFVVAYAQIPETQNTPLPVPSPTPLIPREYLKQVAPDAFPVLDKIATCESQWRHVWNYRHDENPDYFTAFGFFQITKGTAQRFGTAEERMDPQGNIELAIKIYRKNGTRDWEESRHCWSKL